MAWLPYACGSDESTRQNERNATGIRENGTCKVFLLKLKSEFSHLGVIFDTLVANPKFLGSFLREQRILNTTCDLKINLEVTSSVQFLCRP